MDSSCDTRPVVGIDLHRRRTVLVTMQPDGAVVGKPRRILNDPARLKAAVTGAGAHPRVVLEATYSWYWAVDALQAAGAEVHLAHPLGVKMFWVSSFVLAPFQPFVWLRVSFAGELC